MNSNDITAKLDPNCDIISARIRVGRNISGYGLSPGITRKQRLEIEELMQEVLHNLPNDLSGKYYPLLGMNENKRKELVNNHYLFRNGDSTLKIGLMTREWPEGRGIFYNNNKTFLVWLNEEDQIRIISMEKGKDINKVFNRLSKGVKIIKNELNKRHKTFEYSPKLGYIHSCPSNLGTGMRASVHIRLLGWKMNGGKKALKLECNKLALDVRGIHGETSKEDTGIYDISNKYRLGYTEVELINNLINGINILQQKDQKFRKNNES